MARLGFWRASAAAPAVSPVNCVVLVSLQGTAATAALGPFVLQVTSASHQVAGELQEMARDVVTGLRAARRSGDGAL